VISASQPQSSSLNIRALTLQCLFIALVLGAPFGIATTPFVFRDGDTSWQVAAGEWILGHGHIPTSDPFSFTAAGHAWVAMEWLAEVVFGAAFAALGFAGVAAIAATAFMGLHAIIFFHLQRRVSIALLAATLVMLDFVLAPFVMARPHALSWPLIAAWATLLLTAAEKGRPPPPWAALILVVWSNLHASFPLAIPIMGAIALDALIATRWTTIREWILFGIVSLIAVCLNANGLAGLRQPFETSSLAMLPLIGEWHHSSPHATPFFFAVVGIAVAALLWSDRKSVV